MKKALGIILMVLALVCMIAGPAMAERKLHQGGRYDRDGVIGKDTRSLRKIIVNSIVGEGPTSDAYETSIYFQDVAADTWFLFPNSSSGGTLTVTDGSGGLAVSGTDSQILIYNAATSQYDAMSLAGELSITNAGATALANVLTNGADGEIMIYNAAYSKFDPVPVFGEVSITNAGATALANVTTNGFATYVLIYNSGTSKFNPMDASNLTNTVSFTIASGAVFNSINVDSTHTLMGSPWPYEAKSADVESVLNTVYFSGGLLHITLANAAGAHTRYYAPFLK